MHSYWTTKVCARIHFPRLPDGTQSFLLLGCQCQLINTTYIRRKWKPFKKYHRLSTFPFVDYLAEKAGRFDWSVCGKPVIYLKIGLRWRTRCRKGEISRCNPRPLQPRGIEFDQRRCVVFTAVCAKDPKLLIKSCFSINYSFFDAHHRISLHPD